MILDDLDELEAYWIENGSEMQLDEIISWRKDIQEKLAIIDLKNNIAIKSLISGLQSKISLIDTKLTTDTDVIGEKQGKYLYHEKLCWQWLLSFFQDSENFINNKQKEINDNLNE